MKLTHFILATLVGAACVLLAACSANAGAPVPLTNVLVTVYGEESSAIVHERGELFLFEEDGSTDLWFGDGETPGGRPVNTHLPVPDAYHWEDDVHANSHALVLNPEFSIQATANSFDLRFEGVPVLRIVGNTNGFCVPYTYQFQPEGSTFAISSALVDDAALTLLCSTNLTSVPIFREVPDDLATVTTNNGVVTWVVSADALMAPSGANICVFRVRASTSFGTAIYATAPIVAEQGLSMGGITWTNLPDVGTIATNAADAAVAPVEERVGELEERTEEYWCKWTGDSLTTSGTNWIPTDWPARSVYCYVYCASGTNTIATPPQEDFAPAAAHTLHLRIFKAADATVYVRAAGGGGALASLTGGSIIHRDVVLAWRPGIGWICTQITISAAPMAVGADDRTRHVYASDLPEDDRFAPVILDSSSQALSMSPSLSPSVLSPEVAANLELLDNLDALAVPAADEPDELEPAEVVE